jgi:hypothetical protein
MRIPKKLLLAGLLAGLTACNAGVDAPPPPATSSSKEIKKTVIDSTGEVKTLWVEGQKSSEINVGGGTAKNCVTRLDGEVVCDPEVKDEGGGGGAGGGGGGPISGVIPIIIIPGQVKKAPHSPSAATHCNMNGTQCPQGQLPFSEGSLGSGKKPADSKPVDSKPPESQPMEARKKKWYKDPPPPEEDEGGNTGPRQGDTKEEHDAICVAEWVTRDKLCKKNHSMGHDTRILVDCYNRSFEKYSKCIGNGPR